MKNKLHIACVKPAKTQRSMVLLSDTPSNAALLKAHHLVKLRKTPCKLPNASKNKCALLSLSPNFSKSTKECIVGNRV